MARYQFLASLTLLILTIVPTVYQDNATGESGANSRPLLYDLLLSKQLGAIAEFPCKVKEFLNDRQVSDRIYHLIDGVPKVGLVLLDCGDKLYMQVLKNQSSAVGKGFHAVYSGKELEFNSLRDAWENFPNILTLIFRMPIILGQLDTPQIIVETDEIFKQFQDQCITQNFQSFKEDVKALTNKVEDLFQTKLSAW